MNILAIEFSLAYDSLDLYISGCKGQPHCKGCHNPETWRFDQGKEYKTVLHKIKQKIIDNSDVIKRICIYGGEPLDQDKNELIDLLSNLNELNIEIVLFTRYNIDEIDTDIKNLCDVIKSGRYIEELKTDNGDCYFGMKLASSNQKFHIL